MFGGLTHAPAEHLAARLSALLPGDLDRVFFSDSGSVAVEVAIKMATQYWLNRGMRGRHRLIAFHGGYHGDTLGTMAVCDPKRACTACSLGSCRGTICAGCRRMPKPMRCSTPFSTFMRMRSPPS